MPIYAISFRIKDTSTRPQRYKSLVEKIEAVSVGHTWDETTSFYIIECNLGTDSLAYTLYYETLLLSDDHILVVNLSEKTHKAYGEVIYPNILKVLMASR